MRIQSEQNPQKAASNKLNFGVILSLLPYVWQFKWRVGLALLCLVLAKVASVILPIFLKDIVDQLSMPTNALVLPVAALLAYGLARVSSSLFGELRDALFAKVTQGSIRKIAKRIFEHLFGLSMRFHLLRQTGGLSRDIDRGTKGIGFVLNFTLFNILPTLLELLMVMGILLWRYDVWFAGVTMLTIVAYILFTFTVTEKRMVMRRRMNSLDSMANTQAIDALINYETVKYFNNEAYEINRYDENLGKWVDSSVKNQISLNFLNAGQGVIITLGITILLWMSADRVVQGSMTVGDVVLVSAYLTQLYAPLNFLGFIYREIKNSLSDMERMFGLMDEQQEIKDDPGAIELNTRHAEIEFRDVCFSYESERQILHHVSFKIGAGETVAVVGTSGAGKSTLSRLLFRFYDVSSGSILINGRDIRSYTQLSLRQHIGIVPQDTVLFNNTIYYNIAYGRPSATHDEVIEAAKSASIHQFVTSLPDGYESQVGERGLKLSGGEKQRVAIARTILKDPPILVLDEATSALDTRTERKIQDELFQIAKNRTTLIIAHRLSTIVDADRIIVMDQGRIMEQGTHSELLEKNAIYARMWAMQFQASDVVEASES
ncbi:ABC transporter ATP-binding protein/permease [Advenella alkanexedens]|uniref:ABC transporter ATP-binding protein/permease n=1 Tax=Advenella alkanexedens TaxID=1481665 RepID=A0ABS6NNL0_9BURK|nr:ABC transporter ATP-binding protein/permease [Advenella alkanexedens]MBV4396964.1 ABC transporter ATP-binding protein/permease [Advenella alkanexedens]WKU20579.1 ABC transporter ATP-binding protein/permease [Advenella alkanexedens]